MQTLTERPCAWTCCTHPGTRTEPVIRVSRQLETIRYVPVTVQMGKLRIREGGARPGSHRPQSQDHEWPLFPCRIALPAPCPDSHTTQETRAPTQGRLTPVLAVFFAWGPDQAPSPISHSGLSSDPQVNSHPSLREPRALKSSVIIHCEINPGI